MEKQYFRCYELFYKIWKELPQELQAKYFVALMEYGLYWTEPHDPIIKSLMQWPMFSMDRSQEISEIRSEQWKKHKWNQYMKWDTKREAQKNPLEQNGTKVEQNGTWSNKKIIEDIEVIEDNRSNKKNNINKKKYLDFVYLAQEEHDKLVSMFWNKQTDELIDKLNNYIWSTWKRYKSHYFTILNRAKKEAPKTYNSYEREQAMLRHRQQITEQIDSFNSQSNQDGTTDNKSWCYNRRKDIGLS